MVDRDTVQYEACDLGVPGGIMIDMQIGNDRVDVGPGLLSLQRQRDPFDGGKMGQ